MKRTEAKPDNDSPNNPAIVNISTVGRKELWRVLPVFDRNWKLTGETKPGTEIFRDRCKGLDLPESLNAPYVHVTVCLRGCLGRWRCLSASHNWWVIKAEL